MGELTVIYYTCNVIPEAFAEKARYYLDVARGDLPLISVSHKPMDYGHNIVVDLERSHFNIYRQALIGAKAATTPYIALCEDDVFYSQAHFKYRPSPGKFAYNLGAWSLFTWGEPMYTHKGKVRRNLNSLICERELFIEAMEERFAKYPNPQGQHLKDIWAEPGKYERQLGVTVRETEEYYANPPNLVFSHADELSFYGLGTRKRVGEFRAYDIPFWGPAKQILREIQDVRPINSDTSPA